MARLGRHPNVARLLGQATENGYPCVVMEYCQSSLDDLVCEKDGLSQPDQKDLLKQVCLGMAHIHRRGIIHRNLSPSSILLNERTVKISCFDLSTRAKDDDDGEEREGNDSMTSAVGTWGYLAPEVRNGHYGKKIDIYAIGVIAFLLAMQRLPKGSEGELRHKRSILYRYSATHTQ